MSPLSFKEAMLSCLGANCMHFSRVPLRPFPTPILGDELEEPVSKIRGRVLTKTEGCCLESTALQP